MKIIIDTHTLLWFLNNDKKLSKKAKKIIENTSNDLFISIASFWEISIKLSLSKLVLDIPFKLLFDESEKLNIKILHIKKEHLITLTELPFIHRDPFDRIIVSQGIFEGYVIISIDKIFDKYKIKRIW
ncbi:MAG: type II toxin-antitoxin system VapC family toxin [Desulfobacterales bacterium]|nr:type II toxin-antitoxin system VapC family toxin [Desulfobacterales bacterium]MBF0398517.1 type II toxin-antitoxin system VapC family toxin [Desulfobacterales bacterium]